MLAALKERCGIDTRACVDYHEHALRRGHRRPGRRLSVECPAPTGDRRLFGVGIDGDVATASVKAVLSAAIRL